MFFISDSMAADSLKEISGRIHSKTGPIKILVHPSDPPRPRKGMDNGGVWVGGGGGGIGGRGWGAGDCGVGVVIVLQTQGQRRKNGSGIVVWHEE